MMRSCSSSQITGRELLRDTRLPLELSVRWTNPVGNARQTDEVAVAPLTVVEDRIYAEMPRSVEVSAQTALLKASADQRRAMELDRSGLFVESRQLLHQAAELLMAAPETDEVLFRRNEASSYAAHDSSAPLTEHTRKQAVHDAISRSRRRQPVDPS